MDLVHVPENLEATTEVSRLKVLGFRIRVVLVFAVSVGWPLSSFEACGKVCLTRKSYINNLSF